MLVSGGGNDLAGPELVMALEHAASGRPVVNDTIVSELVDRRLRRALKTLVQSIGALTTAKFGAPLPVIVHGYAFPVPDDRGFSKLKGWGLLPGPWLGPSFARKGLPIQQLEARQDAMRSIVARFNDMLSAVAQEPSMEMLHVVDLTDSLPSGADYREWWANELHPTPLGFQAVTAMIAAAVDEVASGGSL